MPGTGGTAGFLIRELRRWHGRQDRPSCSLSYGRVCEAGIRREDGDIFANIVNEESFVEASLVQNMRDPLSILNYEVWNESHQSFMKNQMSKAYRTE